MTKVEPYTPWSEEDEKTLKTMIVEGKSMKQITKKLGRNEVSVRRKYVNMGLRRRVTIQEYNKLDKLYHDSIESLEDWINLDGTLEAIITIVEELVKWRDNFDG